MPTHLIDDPAFNAAFGASMDLYLAWTTADVYNGDRQGHSVGGRSDEQAPRGNGYPLHMVLEDIQSVAVRNPDGSWRVPFYTPLPVDFAGSPMIGLAGHPLVSLERAAPTSAVCTACHDSTAARNHMTLNGGIFNDSMTGKQALGSDPVGGEFCFICHGQGRSFDTAVVHGTGN